MGSNWTNTMTVCWNFIRKEQKKETTAVEKWLHPSSGQCISSTFSEAVWGLPDHPPFSPDLTPYNFFSFPQNHVCTQGNSFQVNFSSEEENNEASATTNGRRLTALLWSQKTAMQYYIVAERGEKEMKCKFSSLKLYYSISHNI